MNTTSGSILKIEIRSIGPHCASEIVRNVTNYLDNLDPSEQYYAPTMSFSYEKEEKNDPVPCVESTPFSRYINSPTVPKE